MKIISTMTLWLGILLGIAGAACTVWAGWISYRQWLALDALRSAEVQTATLPLLLAAVGLLVGGFLIGLGIGVTPKKPKTDPAPPQPVDPTPSA